MNIQSNLNHFNGFVQEIRRFNEETSAFINETLHTLRNLEALVDHRANLLAEVKSSTASNGSGSNGNQNRTEIESNGNQEPSSSESNDNQERDGGESNGNQNRAGSEPNGRRKRVAVKRSSDDPGDPSPIKKPKLSNEQANNEAVEIINEGGHNGAPDTIDDEMSGHMSVMNINANMGENGTLEYLKQWLARVYDQTAKFYTIKKYSRMGTFMFYVAIDVNLDETKDDIHVVINSDHLHRPDVIFRFIENCFQERKVVTLLHIITTDEHHVRADPVGLEKIIRTMVEPIVVHL